MFLPLLITWAGRMRAANAACVRFAFYLGTVIWGIRVKTVGTASKKLPLLLVSNHFSYLDVFVLGSTLEVRFTPKKEIASWPVIGFFCRITGCVFIDRRRSATLNNKKFLDTMVKEKSLISLFPEGTTNEGTGLLPFKSSFFSIADNADVTVQPVSILYTALNGKPITASNRHKVGWYGEALFFPHLVVFLQQRNVDVTLVFHKAVKGKDFSSRKELAGYCRDIIEQDLAKRS